MATAEALKAKPKKKLRRKTHRRPRFDPDRRRRYHWEQVFDAVLRTLIEAKHPVEKLVEDAMKIADESSAAHEARFKGQD